MKQILTNKRLQEKWNHYNWCKRVVRELESEMTQVLKGSIRVPKEPGGWWHQYVCPTHHTELLYDPVEEDAQQYFCPHGCRLEGEAYRGAWLVFKHQEMARTALTGAALYSVCKEQRYADAANQILGDYAKQYPLYPEHPNAQPWMLKGRAFHQALTEAIWSTTLIRAYLLLKDEDALWQQNEALLHRFFHQLESSMTVYRNILIEDRQQPESNYTAWLNACLACIYAATKNADKMKVLIETRGGLQDHLSLAIRRDQLEFEGSIYYHIFVLRAYLIAAEMAAHLGLDLYDMSGEQGQTYQGMLEAMLPLTSQNGELPALHDGPYQRLPYAREIAEVFEIGLSQYGDRRYIPIIQEAYRQISGEPERYGIEALLYGNGQLTEEVDVSDDQINMDEDEGQVAVVSRLYPDSGFVVGKHSGNRLAFVADFGPHGGSHGHDDKLNLVVIHDEGFVLPERGMVPYGSELRKDWFSRTQSHNTVSIGGTTQHEHTGTCQRFEVGDHYTYAWLRSDEAYPGAVLERHLCVSNAWLLDWFTVTTVQDQMIEWWMHALHGLKGSKETNLTPLASSPFQGNDPAYKWIHPVAKCRGKERHPSFTCWHSPVHDSTDVSISLLAPFSDETVLFRAPGTSLDPSDEMEGLVHRQFGSKASFIAVYKDAREPVILDWEEDDNSAFGQLHLLDGDVKTTVNITKNGLQLHIHERHEKTGS